MAGQRHAVQPKVRSESASRTGMVAGEHEGSHAKRAGGTHSGRSVGAQSIAEANHADQLEVGFDRLVYAFVEHLRREREYAQALCRHRLHYVSGFSQATELPLVFLAETEDRLRRSF
jgi:hypothetical protein